MAKVVDAWRKTWFEGDEYQRNRVLIGALLLGAWLGIVVFELVLPGSIRFQNYSAQNWFNLGLELLPIAGLIMIALFSWLPDVQLIAGVLAIPLVLFVPIALLFTDDFLADSDPKRELVAEQKVADNTYIRTYRINPGAMSSYRKLVCREVSILPGITYSTYISGGRFYD